MTDTHDERRKSLHEEWLETPPDERGQHPIDEIAATQELSNGDACPLSGCDGNWTEFEIVTTTDPTENDEGDGKAKYVPMDEDPDPFDGETVVLACDRTACPLSLDNPIMMSQYVEGRAEMERAGNPYESDP